MTTPLGKRRKLNDTSALLKPFKSPLRNPQSKPESEVALAQYKSPTPEDALAGYAPHATKPSQTLVRNRRPLRMVPTTPAESEEIKALQREHTALLNQFASMRAELDKITQALKIEASPRDDELRKLIKQWRTASQQAAEEVYADVRDRVNGMGGLRAWRERERQRAENAWGWDGEDKGEKDDGDDGELEKTEEMPEKQQTAQNDEDEDEGFTVDIMLRTLNIELDVIGYDKEGQKWLD